MFTKNRVVADMKPVAWNGGFNDTAGIAYSGRQNDEKLLNVNHVFFSQENLDA
jgi:hypothetical protein